MEPKYWIKLARLISEQYDRYDGFVVLHGTDTMAYTASALSFMLENLGKPVIITGSQLPIGQLRTDGKENLLTSIEIAAARDADGTPIVPEVCIFFENHLMRGNRTTKINAEGFNAFRSYNCPSLAHAGIHIKYERHLIRRPDPTRPFQPHFLVDNHVIILTLFPGIRKEYVESVCRLNGVRGIILKTFGSGNAPQKPWLIKILRELVDRGVIIVNITQCSQGAVEMHTDSTYSLLQMGKNHATHEREYRGRNHGVTNTIPIVYTTRIIYNTIHILYIIPPSPTYTTHLDAPHYLPPPLLPHALSRRLPFF